MASRQVYCKNFEHRVFELYREGITCKPMLDRLIPEFPEYDLTYARLEAYIDRRQDDLTKAKTEYQKFLEETRAVDSMQTARRVSALEQSTLVTLEQEVERCRMALKQFQPWDKQHAQITGTLQKLLAQIEKFGKTGTIRKVEEAQAVTRAKEEAKGRKSIDPLEQAKLANGKVV